MSVKIKRTLLISSPQLGGELIGELRKEVLLAFGMEYTELLMRKIELISIDENGKIFANRDKSFVEFETSADKWDIPTIWKGLSQKEGEIDELFEKSKIHISSAEDDIKLKRERATDIDDKTNLLVVLPVYKPSSSVFLPYIINKIFCKLGTVGYNYHILGLLPDLEEEALDEEYLPRAYACISECEKILSGKQDLINSFSLLSSKNERNIFLGKTKEIFPTLLEYLNMAFFNHKTIADNRTGVLAGYRGKPALFSSWGFSTYVFKRDRFEKHFQNRFAIKSINEFLASFEKPVERDIFFTDLGQLVGELKWTDKNKLLEDSEGYTPFSKVKKLSSSIFKNNSKDEVKKILDEAQQTHEETHEGYYRKTYLSALANNLSNQTRVSQRIIAEKIKAYLEQGLKGVKKAYALSFALLGKDESGILKGKAAIDPLNIRTAREEIAEFYKQYLPEEERISLSDIKAKERVIKSKQEESDKLLRKIENLEIKLFGKVEELPEITECEEKLFFTIDGQKVHISGARVMEGPIPDSITKYEPGISDSLPKIVDLRPFMTPVEDQQQVGSCTANALVGAYEYLIKRGTDKIKDFSRLFVYYNGRDKGGYADEDKGSAICYCTESMMEKGVCLESTWDYLPEKVTEKPAPKAYEEADKYKVIVAEHFDTDLELMKKCLAEGYPFVFGLKLYKSFQRAINKGIVPIPDRDDKSLEKHGFHAMLCVGYSEAEKCFIVRNSWGEQWGDKGYCYIPFEYLTEDEYRCTENNYLLKTISDVEINEKEILKNIGKDSGSLFNFGYDIHDLNVYKENREILRTEIDALIPELEELRMEFTRQREKVLMESFRTEAEEMDVKDNKEEQEELYEETSKVEEKLTELKMKRQDLTEMKNRLKNKLLIIYPAIGVLGILLLTGFSTFIWTQFDVVMFLLSNLRLLAIIGSIGLIVYAIWGILKFKREAIDKLNEVQDEINTQTGKRDALIENLIDLFDQYFEIRRKHKLNDIFYSFIMEMKEHVEGVKVYFEQWKDCLLIKKDLMHKELPEKEFVDSNIVFNAVSEKDMTLLIKGQNVMDEYFQKGIKPMASFFMKNDELLEAEEGVESFTQDLIEAATKNHVYQQMEFIGIFDFLFDNELLLKTFPGLRKRPLEEKLDIYIQFCQPFIKINATTDAISSHQHFKLQFPKDDTQECRDFVAGAKRKFAGSFSEYDNRNDRSSGVAFFTVKSSLPAFVLEPVQVGYRAFRTLKKENQNKLHVEDFADYSCIPDDIKDLV